jgi:hypothetical protein
MTTWPSGSRDTTEFPDLEINIEGELRAHLDGFTKLDGVELTDYATQSKDSGLEISESRLRTYRKMYEQLGLLYPKNGKIALSRLGAQFKNLKISIVEKRDELLDSMARTAIDILSRYQFKNPVDDPHSALPADFDVFPYVAIWITMMGLEGKLHTQELNRVLLRVERMSDLLAATQKIKAARTALPDYGLASEHALVQNLGEEVITDQPSARMASWFSNAGWGGLIIARNTDAEGFRNLTPQGITYLPPVLASPPPFYNAIDPNDWFAHYIGSQTVSPTPARTFPHSYIALPKPFILLAGISGTGKTRFIREQAEASSTGEANYCLIPVRPDWHEPSDLLGYLSRVGSPRYIVTDLLRFVVAAWKNAMSTASINEIVNKRPCDMTTFWLCLDEMNLAPIEQYFADYLSVLESRKWVGGTYSCTPLLKADAFNKEVGVTAQLRKDLDLSSGSYDGLWAYFESVGIPLPPNLIVAGTVNMDETTHGFSRKVIDRAFTIDFGMFYLNDFTEFFSPTSRPKTLGFPLLANVTQSDLVGVPADMDGTKSINFLRTINEVLKSTPFELAYRALNELLLAVVCFKPQDDWELQAVWDDFLMSKVLPRIDGDAEKLNADDEGSILTKMLTVIETQLIQIIIAPRLDLLRERSDGKTFHVDCRTKQKLTWMQRRLNMNGFTSFWP